MWALYRDDKIVSPLLYSNEKGQDQVVREIVELFDSYDIIFLQGAVGTGKSAIALSVANELNGGIVVVPTKTLQQQYVRDYCKQGGYRILKKDGSWLRIELIKGRGNFRCLYDPKVACNDRKLPCVAPLHDDLSRVEMAEECDYYSPVVHSKLEKKYCEELDCRFETLHYEAVGGLFSVLRRNEEICPYYQQYCDAYVYADVVLMNSAIWEIETLILKRKPVKPVEIVDEGDAFLDNLTLRKAISLRTIKRLEKKLNKDTPKNIEKKFYEIKKNFLEITSKDYEGEIKGEQVSFLKEFTNFLEVMGEDNSYMDIFQFIDECFVSVKDERIEYFIPEPNKVLKELLKLSAKKILFMSATFQSQEVLENVFGLNNYCFVEGETKFPGTVYPKRIGTESRVTYRNWKYEAFRQRYWQNLTEAIKQSSKPCLVTVHAFKYLPENFRERLKGRQTLRTKNGDITFSTVMKRGVDLRDDRCRSIIMLKFPFPDMNDPILKAMKLKLGDKVFWQYYHDIAEREFIQTLGRGVRHGDDWVELWSPDRSVFGYLKSLWKGDIKEKVEKEVT